VWTIVLLGVTSFFTDVASEMAYPLVPYVLTSTLGAGPTALGLIEGLAESLASILRLFSGVLSDRLGKKKALTISGYSASAAGKVMLAMAGSWGLILAARVVDRIGKGIRTAPRDALIADAADENRRGFAFGLHRTMDHAGAVVGICTAWVVVSFLSMPPSQVFLWSVLPASIGVVLLLFVREKTGRPQARTVLPRFGWHAFTPQLKRFLVISGVFALGNSSNTFLLLRGMKSGIPFSTVLLLYLLSTVVAMIASLPAGRLSDRFGRRGLLVGAYLLYAAIYAGFGLLGGTAGNVAYLILFLAYGIYTGIAEGVEKAYIVDLSPAAIRATAIGMHAMVVGIMLLPSSLMAGLLWDVIGAGAPFLAGATLATIASAGLVFQKSPA
jgi:MFS family permease